MLLGPEVTLSLVPSLDITFSRGGGEGGRENTCRRTRNFPEINPEIKLASVIRAREFSRIPTERE